MSDSFSLQRTCPEFRRVSRRGLVHAGVLGTAGLSLANLLRSSAHAAEAPNGAAAKSDKSVILLWMRGGPSHIDMWDPKPDAPAEFRGEFGAMNTKVPSIQLTDMLPKSAAVMDKWSIVSEQLSKLNPTLPAYVMIPRMLPGAGSAYLGPAHKPFETGADPAVDGPFKVQNFVPAEGLTIDRLGSRRQLLEGLDKIRGNMDERGYMEALDRF